MMLITLLALAGLVLVGYSTLAAARSRW